MPSIPRHRAIEACNKECLVAENTNIESTDARIFHHGVLWTFCIIRTSREKKRKRQIGRLPLKIRTQLGH